MQRRRLAVTLAITIFSLSACGKKAEECVVMLDVANKDIAALKTAAAAKPAGGPKDLAAAVRATADAADKLVIDLGKKGPTTAELQKASGDYQAVAKAVSVAARAYGDSLDDLLAVQPKARADRADPDRKSLTTAHDAVKQRCAEHPGFECKAITAVMVKVSTITDKPTDLGKLDAELGKVKMKDPALAALIDKLRGSITGLARTLTDVAAAASEMKDVEAKVAAASAAVDAALAKEAPITASLTAFCK